jgi:hypothetical protein
MAGPAKGNCGVMQLCTQRIGIVIAGYWPSSRQMVLHAVGHQSHSVASPGKSMEHTPAGSRPGDASICLFKYHRVSERF